jgi:hypothetical protein
MSAKNMSSKTSEKISLQSLLNKYKNDPEINKQFEKTKMFRIKYINGDYYYGLNLSEYVITGDSAYEIVYKHMNLLQKLNEDYHKINEKDIERFVNEKEWFKFHLSTKYFTGHILWLEPVEKIVFL